MNVGSRRARSERTRLVHLAGKLSAHHRLGDAARLDQEVEVDAGANPHAFQQVHEILGREVAGGSRRVRAAPDAGDRRIEIATAELEPDEFPRANERRSKPQFAAPVVVLEPPLR